MVQLHRVKREHRASRQFTAVMKQTNDIMQRLVTLAAGHCRNLLLDHYQLCVLYPIMPIASFNAYLLPTGTANACRLQLVKPAIGLLQTN